MTNDFDSSLNRELDAIRQAGLYRELRRIGSAQSPHLNLAGRSVLNFSSNDYLGLANEPAIKQAAIAAVEQFGTGSGASRLVCGSLAVHHELEEALAQFKGAEAALSFSSGYATALGTLGALVGKEDVIVLDKLVHASIVDAAWLSGAKLRVFAHNDMGQLEKILKWADQRGAMSATPKKQRVLIITESVFSMDGDLAPLREIVELKQRHGAWLMLDEAHATGLFGSKRRGLAEAFELDGAVEVQMGTLGKALGSAGGYICGSRALIDLLVNRARSFVFSTAPTPAAAAAATAAVALVQSEEGEKRRNQLWANIDRVKNGLVGMPWAPGVVRSAILPLIVGEESKAMDLSSALLQCGILIPAIRFPTVPRGSARLRLTLSTAHSVDDIATLLRTFELLVQAAPQQTNRPD